MNLYFFTIVIGLSISLGQSTKNNDPQWDLLIYTQRWPITVCRAWEDKDPKHNKCDMPKQPDAWKVHGIWPTRFGSLGPAFCNKTWHFDPEEIRMIETNLIRDWTNIEIEGSTYSFWAHEWNKHGTCAAPIIEPLNTQLKYFTQGLTWLQQYSMTDILYTAGIIPSDENLYSISNIHQAIYSSLGVNPVIECRQDQGKNYLFELRVCFDKSLKFADCDGVVTFPRSNLFNNRKQILTNCIVSEDIIYPQNLVSVEPPKTLYVELYKLITWLQWFTL